MSKKYILVIMAVFCLMQKTIAMEKKTYQLPLTEWNTYNKALKTIKKIGNNSSKISEGRKNLKTKYDDKKVCLLYTSVEANIDQLAKKYEWPLPNINKKDIQAWSLWVVALQAIDVVQIDNHDQPY